MSNRTKTARRCCFILGTALLLLALFLVLHNVTEDKKSGEHAAVLLDELKQEIPETTVPAAETTSEAAGTQETALPPASDEFVERKRDFLVNGLAFYGNADEERGKMSSYTQRYEYRTAEPGQPWELIMEYENVPYEGKNCKAVLCFTSLGLVGINYFDSNAAGYTDWVRLLTEIYGKPDETQYDYTAWKSAPIGDGTMVYVFALEDGVQLSFFADDTGSELAK